MSYISKSVVQFGDSGSIDPFGRARVSTPYTIFDSKQIYDSSPLSFDDQQTSGGGTSSTYNANGASTTIAVSTATPGTRVRQSKRYLNYQPEKGQQIFITFDMIEGVNGVTKRAGYFDGNNGFYLQLQGSTVSICRRTSISGSPTDYVTSQVNWNLDPMDGTGPSGYTLDITKSQILMIDMEWLGVGRVRCALVMKGIPYYFHEFTWSNEQHGVYMPNPNLPVRYEISNNGAGAATGLECICSSVMSEGGIQENGFVFATDRGSTGFTTNNDTNLYPILGLRLNSAKLSGTARVHSVSIMSTTTTAARWGLFLNPTISGTALTYSSVSNSVCQISNTSTNASTISVEGTYLYGGYINQSTTGDYTAIIPVPVYLGSTIAGVSDQIILGVSRLIGAAETFFCSLNWIEG